MAFGERQINLENFTLHIGQSSPGKNVGEIELQIFIAKYCVFTTFHLEQKG